MTQMQVACKYSCDHVTQAVTRELKTLHQPPSYVSDPEPDDDADLAKEKWMDHSDAFGLLLSAAGIESNPEQCPPSLKQQVTELECLSLSYLSIIIISNLPDL